MSKKLLQYYQSKMQTGGKVLPLYAEGDPVPSRYAPIPRASDIRRAPLTPVRQTASEARVAQAFNSGTIRPAKPQNKMAKALSVAANPVTAASYVVRGQRIPDNLDRAEMNRYDMATSIVNPFSYLKQVVDTKRDLEEGNYGSAALNAMGILPMRRPNFNRLTSSNIYDNLGPKLSGGRNNAGVYLLRNDPNYVVKFEDPQRMAHFTDTPELITANYAEAMRDLPDDLPVAKVWYQLDDVRSPLNKGAVERATIMNRVEGMAPGEMNPAFFQQLPEETVKGMYQNLKTLRNNNLAFDFYGHNYRYNPKTKQMGLIDIGIQPTRKNFWADNVYGASNKNLYGIERSGENLKEAMRQMFASDFRHMLQPRFDEIYRGEGNMMMDQLSDFSNRGSANIVRNVTKYLQDIDPFKNGGQHGGLDRWFAEKWVDIKTGKPCGRQEGENRSYPACRPSKRINSRTPKTASELSPAEKARFKREKTSSQRISYNHKRR